MLAITQARLTSTRLPGKVLKEIQGKSLLQIHAERVKASKLISRHIIAISDNIKDDELEQYCKQHGLEVFRGSEHDVLSRFYGIAKHCQAPAVVRLTADCPLIDPNLIDQTIALYKDSEVDYVTNCIPASFPDGMDVEVFSFTALEKAMKEAHLLSDREHVTPFIWRQSNISGGSIFKAKSLISPKDYAHIRLTVDEAADFELISKLIGDLGVNQSWQTYADHVLTQNLFSNAKFKRNEGYNQSLKQENHE